MSTTEGPVSDGALATSRTGRVVAARRLLQGRARRDLALMLVEGPQAVREALATGTVLEVFLTPAASARHDALVASAGAAGARIIPADDQAVASLCGSTTPQGIVAVCRRPALAIDAALGEATRLLVGLVEVRDPGNAGSVIRVADAAGADGVILTAGSVDASNDKVIRSSTGSLFHLPVVEDVSTEDLIERARASGLQVLAADAHGEDLDLLGAEVLGRPTLWLFGNEAHGLSPEVESAADRIVRVPIHGRAESLNLATAVAVCLYSSARAMRNGSTTRS